MSDVSDVRLRPPTAIADDVAGTRSVQVSVFGTGCGRCRATFARVESVAREAGVPLQLDKVEDLVAMAALGIRALPAVAVNGVVVHVGSVPSGAQVLAWLLHEVDNTSARAAPLSRTELTPPNPNPRGEIMKTLRVYDPALCCSTGVCGPTVDPDLARFAGDLEWLKGKGVSVERFNLAQQPDAFVVPSVMASLEALGDAALPLVQLGEATIATGHYPTREVLAKLAGVPLEVEAPKASCCGPKATTASKPEGGSCC